MIRIYGGLESLSRAAAGLFVRQARRAVEERGRFTVALSGGETPLRAYQLLAGRPFRGLVPWSGVHLFWGDERCVPPEDPRSNARMVREALLDRVPVPDSQVHPIECGSIPAIAADRYENLLRGFFEGGSPRFDLVFLGLGRDGHTASLFPGTSALEERDRWVIQLYVAEQTLHRVTLTASLINQAGLVAFLVSGSDKAEILREVLEGPRDIRRLPAQSIRPAEGRLLWLVDRDAGRLLTYRDRVG